MDKLKDKYCKIVTKESSVNRVSADTGILQDINYEDGFILINSSQEIECLSISAIVAIKPRKK